MGIRAFFILLIEYALLPVNLILIMQGSQKQWLRPKIAHLYFEWMSYHKSMHKMVMSWSFLIMDQGKLMVKMWNV